MTTTLTTRIAPTGRHERTLRLGFIGLGWIGRARMASLLEHDAAVEASLYDTQAAACDEALARARGATACASCDELLDRELDGVVIATPNMLHEEQCLAAIERGLPVFCQKPLAPTAAAARRIVDAARANDVLLAVDWSYRWLRGVRYARDMIERGDLGEVAAVDLTFHNAWGPDGAWFYDRALAGGGCLIDLGVHLLDLALLLSPPDGDLRCAHSRVTAAGRPLQVTPSAPPEDFVWASLQATGGPGVRLACSWRAHVGANCDIGVHIHATRGGVSIRNVDGTFFDFETHHHASTASTLVATDDGSWGGGALADWAERLRAGDGFDEQAARAVRVAELVEEVYGRAAACAS